MLIFQISAEKMIYLKTIRLGFLNVGPKVQSVEIFEYLENLYLQNNRIQEIGTGLQMNLNLTFLALQHNQIKKLEGIKHLKNLSFLDISYNQIEEFSAYEYPENLLIVKVHENPFSKKQASEVNYRKQLVLRLQQLEELDRIKVIEAERLAYKGLIKIDVEKLLDKFKQERQHIEAKEKMDRELYLEYMDDIGSASADRMLKGLEDFAKMDGFDNLHQQFQDIIKTHHDQKQALFEEQAIVQRDIEKQRSEMTSRYAKKKQSDPTHEPTERE